MSVPVAGPPAHLYLHVPYCAAKCPYCDFNSIAGREDEYEAYVTALLTEVRRLSRGPYATIFMGGGTPTVLPPRALARLLDGLRDHLDLAKDYEWTCEANPGSSDAERFALLAAHGVNRLSIGVQSVQAHHLRFLGRIHDLAEADRAVAEATRHVPRVSADLIIGLPGQTGDEVEATIAFIAGHGLRHASVYHLAIEPGTEFHARHQRGELALLAEERSRELLDLAWSRLAAAGLQAYETSNFAAPGDACRHNLAYWRGRDYAAAGAGAVSTVDGRRLTREPHPGKYIRSIMAGGEAVWKREMLTPIDRLIEAWMLGLRLHEGVDLARLVALGDRDERWREAATVFERQGLIDIGAGRLRLTPAGRALQDRVTVGLMPDPEEDAGLLARGPAAST